MHTPKNPPDNAPAKSAGRKKDFNFFYDVVKVLSGNGFVQVLRILLSPIISRLFLPEFFGVTQNFSSIANIFGVISSLRYDQSIMLPREKEKAANQFGISLLFLFITTPISLITVWLFKDKIADVLNAPKLAPYLWFVPIQVFAIGASNTFKQWNARKRKFLQLSMAEVTREVVVDGMTVGFGFADLANSSSMIISRMSGQLLSTFTLGLLVLKEDGKFIVNQIRWKKMKAGMREYKKFPQFNVWAAFLSTLSLYLPGILLSAYFSPTTAGYFSMGQSVLRLPVALIGNSIGQVFFQRSAKSYHEGKFKAGVYSQILSLWTLMIFLASPLSNIPNILGKNEVSVILNISRVVVAVSSLVIGGVTGNIYLGLWLFTITGSITLGVFVFWITTASGIPVRTTLKYLLDNLVLSSPFLALIIIFQRFNPLPERTLTNLEIPLPYLGLLLFSILIGIIYYLIVLLRDPSIKEALQKIIKKRINKNRFILYQLI